MNEETIFQDLLYLDILKPIINEQQNTLYFLTELKKDNDIEFFNVLVDMITVSNKTNKKALLVSFANKDNVYTRYLETRYHLKYNIDLTNYNDGIIDFAIKHTIEHPPKLISLNIHDRQINDLKCVIDSFIKNDIDKVFIRNLDITQDNLQLVEYLQQLAAENKLMLVVQFRACKNTEIIKQYNLKNIINIKQTYLKNLLVYYFENKNQERSQYYQLDYTRSTIKVIAP